MGMLTAMLRDKGRRWRSGGECGSGDRPGRRGVFSEYFCSLRLSQPCGRGEGRAAILAPATVSAVTVAPTQPTGPQADLKRRN